MESPEIRPRLRHLSSFPAAFEKQLLRDETTTLLRRSVPCPTKARSDGRKHNTEGHRLPGERTLVHAFAGSPLTCSSFLRPGPYPPSDLFASQGYGATLASFGPFSALYFMFYEQAKARSKQLLGEEPEALDTSLARVRFSRTNLHLQGSDTPMQTVVQVLVLICSCPGPDGAV